MRGSIRRRLLKDGTVRYDARWRAAERLKERTFRRKKDAEAFLDKTATSVRDGSYFEVQPAVPLPHITTPVMRDLVYPDGYQLTQELGSDTGEKKRHRGFYIIDRSLPVAFEPGENHNVDRAVLLRRFIE